jgi:hypothetical protein
LNLCDFEDNKYNGNCAEGLKQAFYAIRQGEYIRLPAVTLNGRPVYALDMGSIGRQYLFYDIVTVPRGRWYVGLEASPLKQLQLLQSRSGEACPPQDNSWNINMADNWWDGKLDMSTIVGGAGSSRSMINILSTIKCPAARAALGGRPNSTKVVGTLAAALAELSCIGRIQRLYVAAPTVACSDL